MLELGALGVGDGLHVGHLLAHPRHRRGQTCSISAMAFSGVLAMALSSRQWAWVG